MVESELFRKIKRGRCPLCGGVVRVIESEINELILNSEGHPREVNGLTYTCTGYCCSCVEPLYIDPTGGNYEVIPFDDAYITMHNSIKRVLGDKQKICGSKSCIGMVVPPNTSDFVKK